MDVGVEVGTVGEADGVGGDEAAEGGVVVAAAEVGEACFGVEAFAGKAPGVEFLVGTCIDLAFAKGSVAVAF